MPTSLTVLADGLATALGVISLIGVVSLGVLIAGLVKKIKALFDRLMEIEKKFETLLSGVSAPSDASISYDHTTQKLTFDCPNMGEEPWGIFKYYAVVTQDSVGPPPPPTEPPNFPVSHLEELAAPKPGTPMAEVSNGNWPNALPVTVTIWAVGNGFDTAQKVITP